MEYLLVIAIWFCLLVAYCQWDTNRQRRKRRCWHPNVGWYEPFEKDC